VIFPVKVVIIRPANYFTAFKVHTFHFCAHTSQVLGIISTGLKHILPFKIFPFTALRFPSTFRQEVCMHHLFPDAGNCPYIQSDTKKQEHFKTSTTIEEIQEKMFNDRN